MLIERQKRDTDRETQTYRERDSLYTFPAYVLVENPGRLYIYTYIYLHLFSFALAASPNTSNTSRVVALSGIPNSSGGDGRGECDACGFPF